MKKFFQYFGVSLIFAIVCLIWAGIWASYRVPEGASPIFIIGQALFTTCVLGLMEVSLSFDNAVVNASILKGWGPFWTKMFLTLGIIIAVFGMRFLFPLIIVGVNANMGLFEVGEMALKDPTTYSSKLVAHHAEVASFGGMFLMMVFLNFFFDEHKTEHWFGPMERGMKQLAPVTGIAAFVSILALMATESWLSTSDMKEQVLEAGVSGLAVYLGVQFLSAFIETIEQHRHPEKRETGKDAAATVSIIAKGGIGGFIYLEILDASFSFDGVIGAFAITNDLIIIMLGLAIGAMFVRSITIFLVSKGALGRYIYLEHGAHWAIGILSVIMLLTIRYHIPEVVTGVIGIICILLSLVSSIQHNKKNRASESGNGVQLIEK